jgi:hypothetical protein
MILREDSRPGCPCRADRLSKITIVIPSEARDLGSFRGRRKPRFLVAWLLGMTKYRFVRLAATRRSVGAHASHSEVIIERGSFESKTIAQKPVAV